MSDGPIMLGYDRDEALAFILRRINRREHMELDGMIEKLILQAIDADLAFMHETGVLREDGSAGDAYYEEDDAFEAIVEDLAERNAMSPEQAVKMASLVDDFMDAQQAYLEYCGLVQDED